MYPEMRYTHVTHVDVMPLAMLCFGRICSVQRELVTPKIDIYPGVRIFKFRISL